MTFSLAGRCARTGMLGAIVTSSSPAVAARCAFARAGVGAACSQNVTDPRLGPALLDRLQSGDDAAAAMARVRADATYADYRQLTVIGAEGPGVAVSGARTLGTHTTVVGTDAVAAGNLLTTPDVPQAMLDAFEGSPGDHIGDRLLAALAAGERAGGEEGPVHSCGMLVVDRVEWPVTDLRVDWDDDPVSKLAETWAVWKSQAEDYVTRGLDPTQAPSYGVPGDE